VVKLYCDDDIVGEVCGKIARPQDDNNCAEEKSQGEENKKVKGKSLFVSCCIKIHFH